MKCEKVLFVTSFRLNAHRSGPTSQGLEEYSNVRSFQIFGCTVLLLASNSPTIFERDILSSGSVAKRAT